MSEAGGSDVAGETITVDPEHPDQAIIARAADILRNGGLVAFPTETVYGLGANALDARAVGGIFEAKGRPAWNPVIAHVASVEAARALTTAWPDAADRLARAFWPGPLTLVLPRNAVLPDIVTAGLPAVAIRIPAHSVALALITRLNAPVAAPSANRFTELSPTTAAHVHASLGRRVRMILDGGPCDVGIESTVLDLTSETPTILRPGIIGRDALIDACGTDVIMAPHDTDHDNTPRLSPGRVARHYAPRATVWLFDAGDTRDVAAAVAEHRARHNTSKIGALLLDWSLALPAGVEVVSMPRDPLAYARSLYAALHQFDEGDYAVVAIERPPVTSAWAGVNDRLGRAAHAAS